MVIVSDPNSHADAQVISSLVDYARRAAGRAIDVSYQIWLKLKSIEDLALRAKALREVLLVREQVPDDQGFKQVVEEISPSEFHKLDVQYNEVAEAMLVSLLSLNLCEEDFYRRLVSTIDNPFFETDYAKSYCLHNLLIDRRLPYFYFENGLKMAPAEYAQRTVKLWNEMVKIRFLLGREFSDPVEQADLISACLEVIGDPIDRKVVFSYLISEARRWPDDQTIEKILQQGQGTEP